MRTHRSSVRYLLTTGMTLCIPFTLNSALQAQQGVLYVDDDAPPGGDGLSWATAFQFLQTALTLGGSEIRVAEGTYYPDDGVAPPPPDPRTVTFAMSQVHVIGGFAGNFGSSHPNERDHVAHPTILSGDLNQDDLPGFLNRLDNSYHVVLAKNLDQTLLGPILDGFRITGGNADGNGQDQNLGGGMLVRAVAQQGSSAASRVRIVNCTFFDNEAIALGGGLSFQASGEGSEVINCSFIANRADSGGGAVLGGADARFVNCVFRCNTATVTGGGLWFSFQSTGSLINCTLSENLANLGGGIQIGNSINAAVTVTNCILWENMHNGTDETSQIRGPAGSAKVSFSDVQFGWTGPGSNNIDADPLFLDPEGLDLIPCNLDDNLRLPKLSPCVGRGSNAALPPDAGDLDRDGDLSEPTPLDLDLQERVSKSNVDMGAYEFQFNGSSFP